MISGFENKLHTMSSAILKRELSEKERVTFLELGAAIGMNTVEELLYMLMIFKRNEDEVNTALASFKERIEGRFVELNALEQKINDTLEVSVNRVLGEGAQAIGRNMGDQIGREARDTLTSHKEYHFLRGQVIVVWMITFLSSVAYALGAAFGFGDDAQGLVETIVKLPIGFSVLFVCGSFYATLWSTDYWRQIKSNAYYKAKFVAQVLVLVALLFWVLKMMP